MIYPQVCTQSWRVLWGKLLYLSFISLPKWDLSKLGYRVLTFRTALIMTVSLTLNRGRRKKSKWNYIMNQHRAHFLILFDKYWFYKTVSELLTPDWSVFFLNTLIRMSKWAPHWHNAFPTFLGYVPFQKRSRWGFRGTIRTLGVRIIGRKWMQVGREVSEGYEQK